MPGTITMTERTLNEIIMEFRKRGERIAELEQTVFHLRKTCENAQVYPAKDIYFYGKRPEQA